MYDNYACRFCSRWRHFTTVAQYIMYNRSLFFLIRLLSIITSIIILELIFNFYLTILALQVRIFTEINSNCLKFNCSDRKVKEYFSDRNSFSQFEFFFGSFSFSCFGIILICWKRNMYDNYACRFCSRSSCYR